MFGHLVAASYAQIDTAFSDKGGNIGSRKEDERKWQVLDEGDVEPRVAVELNIRAVEKVEAGLVETALCCTC
jgi:hypothetical protein